jgi:hypothetical protein
MKRAFYYSELVVFCGVETNGGDADVTYEIMVTMIEGKNKAPNTN